MALQFDTNSDGLLSQPELYTLANALLSNNIELRNVATQPTRRRSGDPRRADSQRCPSGRPVTERLRNVSPQQGFGGPLRNVAADQQR